MNKQEVSRDFEITADPKAATVWLNLAAWTLALGAFLLAIVTSYRQIHYNIPNDLRSPAVLLVDAFLATIVACGFAVRVGSWSGWADLHLYVRFGLWSAAVFRLLPPMLNEDVLYLKNCGSFDVQYGVVGALVHGALAVLFAFPYAIPVLDLPIWNASEGIGKMCGAVILVFFIVAGVVRLLAENCALF